MWAPFFENVKETPQPQPKYEYYVHTCSLHNITTICSLNDAQGWEVVNMAHDGTAFHILFKKENS